MTALPPSAHVSKRSMPISRGCGSAESLAGYTSGGEQQMCAIGRALMSSPKMILLDEPSMGLAPQIVEEIFTIIEKPERDRSGFVPAGGAERQSGASNIRVTATSWKTDAWCWTARPSDAGRERGREGILCRRCRRQAQIVPRRQALQAAQALAGVAGRARSARQGLETDARRRLDLIRHEEVLGISGCVGSTR